MRLAHFAFVLLALLAPAGTWAAEANWHRSVTLDYTVAASGTSVALETWEVRADTTGIARTIAQQSFTFIADLERIHILAAYTIKADGRRLPVAPGAIYDKAVTTTAAAPQFSALAARTIVFPQVAAGDTVHYELRRTAREPIFPGQFILNLQLGSTATVERADIRIAVPAGRLLRTETDGLEQDRTASLTGEAYRWRLAKGQPGPVALQASTFADYPEVGRAYAARSWRSARPGSGVRATAARLAPPGTPEDETVRRLYRYVASEIRYVAVFLGSSRVVPREAERVLAEGWGDCKDHTALLQALLAAKGIAALPVLISSQDRFDLPTAPGLGALDHVILFVPSLDLYLDSTAAYAPFGTLPANEYDKPVVLADREAPRLGRTPAMRPGAMLLSARTQLGIGADGLVSGHTATVADGPEGVALRAMAAWFEGRGAAYSANAQLQALGTPGAGKYDFESPDNAAGAYHVQGWFTLEEKVATEPGATLTIPAGLSVFGRPGKLLLSAGLTEDGGHICYPGQEVEEIAVDLPPGRRLRALPPDLDIAAGGARYAASYEQRGGTLFVRREFRLDTPHQRCGADEFATMLPVLAAAKRDQAIRIALDAEPPKQLAETFPLR